MSLDIVWMPAALAAFYRIPHWRTAAAVDAAVLAFAAGSGLRVVPGRHGLRAAGYLIAVRVDRGDEQRVIVLHLYPTS